MSNALGPLHTVNKSPFASRALDGCLSRLSAGAAVLLIEDGVYAALADTAFADRLAETGRNHALYVLGPDLAARGLADRSLVAGIEVIDYQGFVSLAARHSLVQAWF
ncbi:sulfurtransferase complex subunit TusB [Telmatospirillum sp.]|uniref:sulfurtransferase complex subunit TusB n=1 Tax=Telmatospirillum sp. TaxID=2079197 RepID=UPI00283C4592|nr:sulfurtransferase complex subunit TusB [Telmatospirillum sp.]MDR3439056.1 sulfurtransferase complex subunit TusB [Telmatospirillum sp.]